MITRFNVLRAIPFACLLLSSTSVLAQQVINGTTETVPGSKPNPWSTGALTVGSTGTGALNVGAGGVVNSTTGVLGSTATGNGTINVTGTGARWNTTGNVTIGNTGQGTLNIGTGGSVSSTGSGTAFIGNSPGGVGTVTVSGAGTTWTNNSIQIGGLWTSPLVPGGSGTMTISDGGSVTSTQSWIGSTTGSVGTVTVTGAGSSWTVNGNLPIGPSGTGTLIIENGAQMTNGQAQFGTSTSTGTAIARGAGTTWTSTAGIVLNKGSVTVEDGAKSINIGQVTSDGTMTVKGVGSSVTSTSLISVGSTSSGTLSVENSATISGLRGRIGIGAAGSTTVAGGSRWDTTEFFRIGESTNGTLTISGGSTVTTGVRASDGEAASIGFNAGGQGIVSVTGANSKFLNSSTLTVGRAGTGTLTVEQNAAMTSAGGSLGSTATGRGTVALTSGGSWTSGAALKIGDASANNSLTVTGTGAGGTASKLDVTGALTVGNAVGSNSLAVSAGALAKSTSMSVGTSSAGNSVLVSGAGSLLSVGASPAAAIRTLVVGDAGANNNVLVSGGAGLTTGGAAWIGKGAAASGNHVDITGAASSWALGGDLGIGGAGGSGNYLALGSGAALTQTGGSTSVGGGNAVTIDTASSFSSDGSVLVGTSAGSATLQLSGSSSLTAKGAIAAGVASGGNNVAILSGSAVRSGSGMLGQTAGANGNTVTVSDNALWSVGNVAGGSNAALAVGGAGSSNTLLIETGGDVEAQSGFVVGSAAGSASNLVAVRGSGSTLRANGGFTVGDAGSDNGVLVRDGAQLVTSGGSRIGAAASGNAVEVNGPASSWVINGDLTVGAAGTKDNLLAIVSGASVTQTGGATVIGSGGNALEVGAGSSFTSDGAISVGSGSRLSLGANSRVNGGSLAMTAGSQLDVFAQEGNSSLVTLSGKADLGGTLNATIDGRSSLTYRFLVLHAGEVEGTFDQAVLNDYSANLDWMVLYTPTDVFLQLEAQIGDVTDLNQNQTNAGSAIDEFFNRGGELPENFIPLLGLTGNALGEALSQLSGEVGASGGAAAAASANTSFMRSMLDHAVPACAEQRPDDPEKRCENAVWASAFGSTAGLPGNDSKGSHDTTTTVGGVATGWDYARDDLRVGIALAGGGTGWNLDGNGMGSGDSTFLQLGAYGTQQLGNAYASLAGTYALQGMSTTRKVKVLSAETLEADFIANAVAGRGEAGYRFGAVDGLGLTPYAALQGQAIRLPGYDETGTLDSGSYALSYDATTTTAVRSELGLGMDVGSEAILFSGRVAWAHDWLNDAQARAGFQSLPGTSFIVNGAEAPSDLALVSLSGDVGISAQTAVKARFDGEFAADYQSYAGTLALTYAW